jgi:hypothetical protein
MAMHAIVADEGTAVARMATEQPALASATLDGGASREGTRPYFFDAIKHYVYAGDTALHVAASGEVARAIKGHVSQRMTEHYSHVDVGEKRAAVEGMLKVVKGGSAEAPHPNPLPADGARGPEKKAVSEGRGGPSP